MKVKILILTCLALFTGVVGCANTSGNTTSTAGTVQSNNQKNAPSPAKPASAPATRQVKGTATSLGAGTFTGGKDVAVGLYDVTAPGSQSGNFMVDGNDSYNEILGSDGVSKVRVKISAGDKIQIAGLSQVTFTPVTTPFVTIHTAVNLYAGTFTVGQDIGAGRYVATAPAGGSGNFMVDGNDSYNEILGSDGVPKVTVDLTDGDTINISGLDQVTMTPSS